MDMDEEDCRMYRHKSVRDLVWVLTSPRIFKEKTKAIMLPSREWLVKLDADPSALMKYIHKHLRGWALGSYYTILINYWLNEISKIKPITEKPVVDAKQLPRRQTLGQLKWVYVLEKEPHVAIHWESSVKFFVDAGASYISESTRRLIKFCRQADETSAREALNILSRDDDLNVNSRCSNSGKTPLMIAAWRGHIDVVRSLLDRGAEIDAVVSRNLGSLGKSAIFFACTRCRDDVVRLLLQRGARVTIVNNKGQTLRSLAATHLKKDTRIEIEKMELEQIRNGGWLDFSSQHDGKIYGDLDPRFEKGRQALASSSSSSSSSIDVVNGTTYESRTKRYESYNVEKKKFRHPSSELRRFVGPYLSENLFERVLTATKKMNVVSSSVKNWICTNTKTKYVRSEYILKGYLFYPLHTSYQSSGRCSKQLNPHHLRGWFVREPEELIRAADVLKTSARTRWAILRKLYWLAPARAETKTDLASERISIPECNVPIGRLECMCKYDTKNAPHSRQNCRSLRNLNDTELLSTSALIRVLSMITSEKSILVCQLEMVPQDNKENVFVWEEVSRGFVLSPKDWHERAHAIRTRESNSTKISTFFPCIYEDGYNDMEENLQCKTGTNIDVETLLSSLKSSTISSSTIESLNGDLCIDFICHHAHLHSQHCHNLLSLLMKSHGKNRNISSVKKEKLRSHIYRLLSSTEIIPYRVFYRVLRYFKLSLDFSNISVDSLREHLQKSSLISVRDLRDFVDLVVLIHREDKLMTRSLAECAMQVKCTVTERQERVDILKRLCYTNLSDEIDALFESKEEEKDTQEEKMILKCCSKVKNKKMHVLEEKELRDIVLVNNEKMLRSVSLDHDAVALDCEWDPKRKTLQLIQIATKHVVYVFDVQEIMNIKESERLTKILSVLFQRSLIFGWCMDSDLTQICTRFPHVLQLRTVSRCIDLQKHVMTSERTMLSLSDACVGILGIGLDKSFQTSNWSKRPLTPEQIQYAALDAWVLLRMEKKIECRKKCFEWVCPFPVPLGIEDVRKNLTCRFSDNVPVIRKLKELARDEILVKTVAFYIVLKRTRERVPVCVVLDIDALVDTEKLKSWFVEEKNMTIRGISDVCLASVRELIQCFGYVPGGLGPFGTRQSMMIVLDKTLLLKTSKFLCCGAGLPDYIFRVNVLDLAGCDDVFVNNISK